MRITAEAYLTAVFRFLGDGLLGENERLDIAVCILDELEEVTGVQFSPDERERLIDTVAKLLSEKTSISDVKEFINPPVVKTTLFSFLCCCPKGKRQLILEDGAIVLLPDGRGIIRKAITGGEK